MTKIKNFIKNKNMFETFTKLWITVLLSLAIVDMQLSYVLAFLGREQIAEELSGKIVVEIVGVMVAYLAKSFFETWAGKNHEFELQKYNDSSLTNSNEEEYQEESIIDNDNSMELLNEIDENITQ